jgi:hypothetical protein
MSTVNFRDLRSLDTSGWWAAQVKRVKRAKRTEDPLAWMKRKRKTEYHANGSKVLATTAVPRKAPATATMDNQKMERAERCEDPIPWASLSKREKKLTNWKTTARLQLLMYAIRDDLKDPNALKQITKKQMKTAENKNNTYTQQTLSSEEADELPVAYALFDGNWLPGRVSHLLSPDFDNLSEMEMIPFRGDYSDNVAFAYAEDPVAQGAVLLQDLRFVK